MMRRGLKLVKIWIVLMIQIKLMIVMVIIVVIIINFWIVKGAQGISC